MNILLLLLLINTPGHAGPATTTWNLEKSELTYTVKHPLKTATGTSHDAKGRGQCSNAKCEFLIAAQVKSFDSGDSNRDLHMLEVTRGAANPMITVRTSFDEKALESKSLPLSLAVEFAGKKATYSDVKFEIISKNAKTAHLRGTILLNLSDFDVKPPSLLTFSIEDRVPVTIDAMWTKTLR